MADRPTSDRIRRGGPHADLILREALGLAVICAGILALFSVPAMP